MHTDRKSHSTKNTIFQDKKYDQPSRFPLISIAMCTYNGAQYLKDQLNSLIAQDYPHLEIIVVDDCSTDATYDILSEYSREHSILRTEQNIRNIGFVKNFEKAIGRCRGEFIALCDQDDIWKPEKISRLFNTIGKADLVYSAVKMINSSGESIDRPYPMVKRLSGQCHMSLLFCNCVTGHVSLIRRSAMTKAMPIPNGVEYHDHWIAFVCAASGGIKAIDDVLSYYRSHDGNISDAKTKLREKHRTLRRKNRTHNAIHTLEKSIIFLECVLARDDLLADRDRAILKYLLAERRKLRNLIVNWRLRRFLRENKHTLLDIYPNIDHAHRKLSRGTMYYRIKEHV